MKNTFNLIILAAITGTLLVGCNLPLRSSSTSAIDANVVATNVQLTIQALRQSEAATPMATKPANKPTLSPTAKVTALPSSTITPTYSAPQLTFDNNVNCRQGPGVSFPIVVLLKEGQTVDVVGAMDKYWIVTDPKSGDQCWLAAEFATPVGSVWTVPTISANTAPTETPPFVPVWKKWNYYCTYTDSGQTLTMEMEWTDKNNNETGFRVLRNGQPIADLPADSSSYTDSVVVDGNSYSYSIEVYRANGSSTSSVIDTACQ